MSLGRLWAFLAVALPTLGALIANLQSVDLAYHLRAGAEIIDTRAIPSVDTWTFTASGLPWTDQQWGAQVILAAAYRIGGWTGLVLLRALLVALIFGSLFEIGRRRGLGLRRAAWLSLAAFVIALPALALRPQLLGMALFAIVLLLIVDRRAHPRRLWLAPIIVLVWANIHGSFFLGPVALGLAWFDDLHDGLAHPHRALQVAIAAILGAVATPFGPAVWTYAVGLSVNPEVTARISEWQPTSLRDVSGLLFFASVVAVVVLIARQGRRTAWPTLAWLGVFFVIGAYAARGIAWWPLGAVVAIAGVLVTGPSEEPSRAAKSERAGMARASRLNALIAAAIVMAAVIVLPLWRPTDLGLDAPRGLLATAPSGITGALRGLVRPGDRIFNPQLWGSWFEFALPGSPVAIDSRIEFFPASAWEAYERVAAGVDGWQAQLKDWGVTLAVVRASDEGLTRRFTAAGWGQAYADADGSILISPAR